MPITPVGSFKVTCDSCGKHGGLWNERESPKDAVPDGWVIDYVVLDATELRVNPSEKVWRPGYHVSCPECQEKVP